MLELLSNDLFVGAAIFMAGVVVGAIVRGRGVGDSNIDHGSVYLDVAGDYYEVGGDLFNDYAEDLKSGKAVVDDDGMQTPDHK